MSFFRKSNPPSSLESDPAGIPKGDPTGTLSSFFSFSSDVQKVAVSDIETGSEQESGMQIGGMKLDMPSLPSGSNFKWFVGLLLMAALFLSMGITFLPLVVLRPQKFAFCFTMASLLFIASLAAMKGQGPIAFCRAQCDPKTLPRTILFYGSMLFTLYASLIVRSYVLVIIAVGFQGMAMALQMGLSIPGGLQGMRIFFTMFLRTAKVMVCSLVRLVIRT